MKNNMARINRVYFIASHQRPPPGNVQSPKKQSVEKPSHARQKTKGVLDLLNWFVWRHLSSH